MKFLLSILLIALSPVAALAHSETQETTPANGAVLTDVPAEIGMIFTDKLRLTKVEATHSGGETQDVDLTDHKSFKTEFTLPFEEMGAGTYDVEWRGLGADGHAMQGAFRFEVE